MDPTPVSSMDSSSGSSDLSSLSSRIPSPVSSSADPLSHARCLVEDFAALEAPPGDTSKLLFAFLDHLPEDSQLVIAKDINDSKDLHALKEHYLSAILIPCMLP